MRRLTGQPGKYLLNRKEAEYLIDNYKLRLDQTTSLDLIFFAGKTFAVEIPKDIAAFMILKFGLE